MDERILLFADRDRPGLIAEISGLLARSGATIEKSEQYTSPEGRFFLRFLYRGDDVRQEIERCFPESTFRLEQKRKKRAAIFASREKHCLSDILWKASEGELDLEIAAVISNHKDCQVDAERFDIPFYLVENREDRQDEENALLEALEPGLDFAILARYMRILSGKFLQEAAIPFINVHHSFLPAFPGARPYEEAYERGVKVIGATSHYVIEELDAGAIISQRTAPVANPDGPPEMKRLGRDLERLALSDAVRLHTEDKIIVENNKTILFS